MTKKRMNDALKKLKEVSAQDEVREIYELRRKTEEGYISERNLAVQKALAEGEKIGEARGEKRGIEKGREEGEKIGAHKEKLETARNFLAMGLSVEQVAQGTGLTLAEVENLSH